MGVKLSMERISLISRRGRLCFDCYGIFIAMLHCNAIYFEGQGYMDNHHDLIGRTFGYCLDVGDDGPLFVVATVKPTPEDLDLPEGVVWACMFSQETPQGEEGVAPLGWMDREIAPSSARMLKGMFEHGTAASRKALLAPLTRQLPLVTARWQPHRGVITATAMASTRTTSV
jgi:hypothetical protein